MFWLVVVRLSVFLGLFVPHPDAPRYPEMHVDLVEVHGLAHEK